MPTPRSVRLSEHTLARLGVLASRSGTSVASVMERLVEEGLRQEDHPRVTFRDGPSGRRAGLIGGPDVEEVMTSVFAVRTNEPELVPEQVIAAVSDVMGQPPDLVRAAVSYYADFPEEIDGRIARAAELADRLEASWRRQQEVLAGSRTRRRQVLRFGGPFVASAP